MSKPKSGDQLIKAAEHLLESNLLPLMDNSGNWFCAVEVDDLIGFRLAHNNPVSAIQAETLLIWLAHRLGYNLTKKGKKS